MSSMIWQIVLLALGLTSVLAQDRTVTVTKTITACGSACYSTLPERTSTVYICTTSTTRTGSIISPSSPGPGSTPMPSETIWTETMPSFTPGPPASSPSTLSQSRTNGVYGRYEFHCTNSPYDGSKFHFTQWFYSRSEVKHIHSVHDGIGVHYSQCFDSRLYFKCTNRADDGSDVHYTRHFYNRPDFEHSNSAYNRADLHYTRHFFNRFGVEYTNRADNRPKFH
ncbi:unnamed protein product [Clonostachys rhizophaga]|uniref:Uncharacterized protein n=1 Tax=Clonostachys rhizophaga TaxID=160324 RepID=A0A9N9W2S6_9HYPO|nr:unnamed protein product [Clonostachys rhizophaga]